MAFAFSLQSRFGYSSAGSTENASRPSTESVRTGDCAALDVGTPAFFRIVTNADTASPRSAPAQSTKPSCFCCPAPSSSRTRSAQAVSGVPAPFLNVLSNARGSDAIPSGDDSSRSRAASYSNGMSSSKPAQRQGSPSPLRERREKTRQPALLSYAALTNSLENAGCAASSAVRAITGSKYSSTSAVTRRPEVFFSTICRCSAANVGCTQTCMPAVSDPSSAV